MFLENRNDILSVGSFSFQEKTNEISSLKVAFGEESKSFNYGNISGCNSISTATSATGVLLCLYG